MRGERTNERTNDDDDDDDDEGPRWFHRSTKEEKRWRNEQRIDARNDRKSRAIAAGVGNETRTRRAWKGRRVEDKDDGGREEGKSARESNGYDRDTSSTYTASETLLTR